MSNPGGFLTSSPPAPSGPTSFEGGNQSHGSILEFCEYIQAQIQGTAYGVYKVPEVLRHKAAGNWPGTASSEGPSAGGTLTINSESLGSYDYAIKGGSQTLASFTNGDWFTATEDSRGAFVVVDGNLTIQSGVTFIPSNRKLFTVLYVTGDLDVQSGSTISMTARGASHDSSPAAAAIRIATGTYDSVSNPQVPAAGASGGASAAVTAGNVTGNNGSAGTAGETGGGASGGARENTGAGTATTGAGAAGTSFAGGPGGGGAWSNGNVTADNGSPSGAAGGDGAIVAGANDPTAFGGAGTPSGSADGPLTQTSTDGTGGVLIIIVRGAIKGAGAIEAQGSQGGYYAGADTRGTAGGGGSGGGSITVLALSGDNSTITPDAAGGAAGPNSGGCGSGTCSGGAGGAGGAGTARILDGTA